MTNNMINAKHKHKMKKLTIYCKMLIFRLNKNKRQK